MRKMSPLDSAGPVRGWMKGAAKGVQRRERKNRKKVLHSCEGSVTVAKQYGTLRKGRV